jgi:hypothetical protein
LQGPIEETDDAAKAGVYDTARLVTTWFVL